MQRSHPIHLTAAGVSVVFDHNERGIPVISYWGRALPDTAIGDLASTVETAVLHSSIDVPIAPSIVAGGADGWAGTPSLEWHASGIAPSALGPVEERSTETSARFELGEARTGGRVTFDYVLHPSGVLEASATLRNDGEQTIDVGAIRLLLPLPVEAEDILDFTGYWSGERKPQRREIANGTWHRADRRGRTGHDSSMVSFVGERGFGFRSGAVWGAHLAWSGNAETVVERLPEDAGANTSVLGAAELLTVGEVRLDPGETYESPSAYFVYSDHGLDGASARLHSLVRAFPSYPLKPRPLVLNSWEAVYFDHSLDRLTALARAAAAVGVERFVLDDGWFLGRRNDQAGLGDWSVDPQVWPNGLAPISSLVHDLGMEFGLWFEPEMANLDSNLVREHPDWLLADPLGVRLESRHQFVVNLGNPDAWQHVFDSMDAVITTAGVDFIKWDHNRDLHEATDASGRPGVHAQTLATYRLMDALIARHPGLEIESCASGGARVDLGIARHSHRVWASDTIDPLERQAIQSWTELLLPPELIGSHVGAALAHTTGRVTSAEFRMTTALLAHAGLEWDLTTLDPAQLEAVTAWATVYKDTRELIRTGNTVHADHVPEGTLLHGIVSPDRQRAMFEWVQREAGPLSTPGRVAFPGLDSAVDYRVVVREDFGRSARRSRKDPPWVAGATPAGSLILSGALLSGAGLPLPALNPAEALLIDLRAAVRPV